MFNKDAILEKYNKRYSAYSPNRYFSIFRVGDKIKYNPIKDSFTGNINLTKIKTFEKHMKRDMEVPNANPELTKMNKTLISCTDLEKKVKDMLYGIKIRKNAVIARDLVLTTGNGFFDKMPQQERDKWVEANIKFLKEEFGENCIYACLHLDETTPHIHALIVPRFFNYDKNRYELRNNVYFDGKDKMRAWQDKYANAMAKEFNNLIRGRRGSKAKHLDIKQFYKLINEDLNIKNPKQVLAYAKNQILMDKKMKDLENTIKNMEGGESKEELLSKIKDLEKTQKIYKETLKTIIKKYNISEKDILSILDFKIKQQENFNQRERF